MVDELRVWAHGRGVFKGRSACHLTVDGESSAHLAALHALAEAIGLRRTWFQAKSSPHYDLTESKRAAAIAAGAVFVPAKEQAKARLARRRP